MADAFDPNKGKDESSKGKGLKGKLGAFFQKTAKKFSKLAWYLNVPVVNTFTGAVLTPFSVRVIDIVKKGDDLFLNAIADSFIESKDPFSPERAKVLTQICKEHNLWARTVNNLAGFRGLMVRQMDMPKMALEEARESLRFTEREAVSFPIDTAGIDVWIIDDEQPGDQMKVLTAIMDEKEVVKYHNLFTKSAFKHHAIVTVPTVLASVVENSKIMDKLDPVPIISIGKTITGIYVYQGGKLKFSRDINIGGGHITDALATKYEVDGKVVELSKDEAEQIKESFGIPQEDEELDRPDLKGVTGRMIREKLQPVLDKFVTEFGRSIDYYKHQAQVRTMPGAYLIGSTARFKNLPEYLTEALNEKFFSYNAFKDFITIEDPKLKDFEELGPDLTLTIGLALDQGDKLNLLPEKLRFAVRKLLLKIAPFAAAIAYMILVVALFFIGIRYTHFLDDQIKDYEARTVGLVTEQQAAGTINEKITVVNNDIRAVVARASILPELQGRNIGWLALYSEIASMLPPDIALDSLDISFVNPKAFSTDGKYYSKQLDINGRVRGEPSEQVKSLRALMQKMQESKTFKHTTLITTGREKPTEDSPSMLTFNIAADVDTTTVPPPPQKKEDGEGGIDPSKIARDILTKSMQIETLQNSHQGDPND